MMQMRRATLGRRMPESKMISGSSGMHSTTSVRRIKVVSIQPR